MHDLFGGFQTTSELRKNHLYYGDNLTIMRSMPTECVDLIYLDPPFNSQRNYNLIYKQMTGLPVPEQEEAFCDAWTLDAEKEQLVRDLPEKLKEYGAESDLIEFWNVWIKALSRTQPKLLAYLVYMTFRLLEMRRILKATGSVYLHCDPTASHYIKVIMDGVFGHDNFRSEIIWKRTSGHSDARRYGPVHDTILFYTKTDRATWNTVYQTYDEEYVSQYYRYKDKDGRLFMSGDLSAAGLSGGGYEYEWKGVTRVWRVPKETMADWDSKNRVFYTRNGIPRVKRYLDEAKGMPAQDVWTDVQALRSWHKEKLGYPTQKPVALVRRIIEASSNPNDVVFDPFCGCGTTIAAAHTAGRRWIGCDIAILSVRLVRDLLQGRYGLNEGEHYEIDGVPKSVDGARELFNHDPLQFQHWAVELAGGFCNTKRSADQGIDGRIYFETRDGLQSMVVSVKGGKLAPTQVRDLRGTLEREGGSTKLAAFICLDRPTKAMLSEAAAAGQFVYQGAAYDRLQVRTVEDLLGGRGFHTPSRVQTMDWDRQMPLPMIGVAT